MVRGNALILDLEIKLNLYSNNIEKEIDTFENNQCEDLVNIVFAIFDKKELSNEVENFNNRYDENLLLEENKIKYGNPRNFSKIGIKIFERLYFKDKETALKTWLEIIKMFESYGFWYWLDELSSIEEVREYFLDEISEYVLQNYKELEENWKNKFNEDKDFKSFLFIKEIPKSFENFFEGYNFFKELNNEISLVEQSYCESGNILIWCLIRHEVSRSYYYNEASYLRINKLLFECIDSFLVNGEILCSRDIKFNTYLLSNSKYCHYGFLNIVTMHLTLNNLINEYDFDYNKQWLDILSNQIVNIFISTLLNNDKNDLIQIVFNTINYLVQSYFKSKRDLISFSLEKFLNKFSSSILKDNKLLFNLIINDLVEQQIKLLEQNKNIKEESYFILNWYLKNLINREKIDDIDYSKLKEDITKVIFQNIEKVFNKSIEEKHFYIDSSQIIDNIDFNLFYEISSENLKNSWINILNFKQLKADLQTDDRYYVSSLGKFYLELLILFYRKTYDEKLERTIIDVVLKLGIEEKLGIFFSIYENKLYDFFLNILNNFKDENYQLFINKVFEIKDIKNLLHIYHTTISSERKKVLETEIKNFDFKNLEFDSYDYLENSINFALNSGFDNLVNTLIDIYKELLEEDKEEALKRQKLKKENEKINEEKKDNNVIRIDININSNEILNAKIQAFEQFKYKKDLIDIYHEKSKTIKEKLVEINKLQLPQINIKNFRNREVKTELGNYRIFVIALINFDEKPLHSYNILKELNQKNPKNHQYLINMLRAYYESYKNDKNKKEKFEYIITEYKKYEKKIDNYEKELYDYQILLTVYSAVNDYRLFVELWSELPKAYYFNFYIIEIRCEFLEKNNQLTEASSYIKTLKEHPKNFSDDDLKKLNQLDENIKNKIPTEVKERILTNVVLEKSEFFDESKARDYWNEIKQSDDKSHAYIFFKKNNIEEYLKNNIDSVLKEVLIRSNHLIQSNGKLVDEDIITDWIISLLREKQKYLSWTINSDRASHSATRKKAGELDLIIRNGHGDVICIGEALKNKIEEHMNKLSGYNASGLNLILVFVYTKEKDFFNYSNNYKEKISKMNYRGFDKMTLPVNIEKVDSQSSTIHLYKDIRQKNKENTIIYHYLLDFN